MTDNTKLEGIIQQQQTAQPEPEPVVTAQPAATKPRTVIKQDTIQTADNTVFKDTVPNKPQSLGDFDPKDQNITFKGFIGLNKQTIQALSAAVELYQAYLASKGLMALPATARKKEGYEDSELLAAITAWEEYCAANHPGVELEELDERYRSVYWHLRFIADTTMAQFPICHEPGLTNNTQRTTEVASNDLNGLMPKDNVLGKMSISEFMRRTSINATNSYYNYDLLLRNSFIALRLELPTRLELGNLIKDIATAVRGHVRQVSQNVPSLANAAANKVVWQFVKNKIKKHSVKDTGDFDELADVIRITDINVIAAALLSMMFPKGVPYTLSCLAQASCGWHANRLIDPTSLVIDRSWLETPKEAAALANIFNFACKYSREDSLKFIKETNFQHDIEPIWNENNSTCLVLGVPSLTESFEANDFFAELIKSDLDRFREESITEADYIEKRDDYLNGLVGTDYLHYIAEYRVYDPSNPSAPPVIVKRAEHDPKEFNQGIVNIIQENDFMAAGVVQSVIKHYPYMSRTFVGMANYICENEKCKGVNEAFEDLGYTPINIMSTFFTLASLMLSGQSTVGENVTQKALMDITQ